MALSLFALFIGLQAGSGKSVADDSGFVLVDSAKAFTQTQTSELLGPRSIFAVSTWHNNAETPVNATVGYVVYAKDGTKLGDCEAQADFVLPGASVKLFCDAATVDNLERGAKAIARLKSVRAISLANVISASVVDSTVTRKVEDNGAVGYFARATIKLAGKHDRQVAVQYRLLDDSGAQLLTCADTYILLQPEVPRKLEPTYCGRVPRKVGKASRMTITVTGSD